MNALLANLLAGAQRPGPVVPPITSPFPPPGGLHGVPPGQGPNPGDGYGGLYPPGTIGNFSPAVVHHMASSSNQELLASLARAKTVAAALQHLRKLRPYTTDGSVRAPRGY